MVLFCHNPTPIIFRIPDDWSVEAASSDLGDKWTSNEDSLLLIGAAKFGKNLLKIVTENSDLTPLCLDDVGVVKDAVRKRFGYLINVYITRGKPVKEFGSSLYSVDVEGGEEVIEEEEKHDEETDDDIVEISESKEDGKENETKVEEESKELETLDENGDNVDEKLLDEAD